MWGSAGPCQGLHAHLCWQHPGAPGPQQHELHFKSGELPSSGFSTTCAVLQVHLGFGPLGWALRQGLR